MEFVNEHWFAIATLLLQCGLLKYVGAYLNRSKAREQATRSLLRIEIINICHKAQKDTYLPLWALENLTDMYSAYIAMHGNGAIKELVEKTKNLPVRREAL